MLPFFLFFSDYPIFGLILLLLLFFFSASKIFLITRQDLGLVFVVATGLSASGALELPALGT